MKQFFLYTLAVIVILQLVAAWFSPSSSLLTSPKFREQLSCTDVERMEMCCFCDVQMAGAPEFSKDFSQSLRAFEVQYNCNGDHFLYARATNHDCIFKFRAARHLFCKCMKRYIHALIMCQKVLEYSRRVFYSVVPSAFDDNKLGIEPISTRKDVMQGV